MNVRVNCVWNIVCKSEITKNFVRLKVQSCLRSINFTKENQLWNISVFQRRIAAYPSNIKIFCVLWTVNTEELWSQNGLYNSLRRTRLLRSVQRLYYFIQFIVHCTSYNLVRKKSERIIIIIIIIIICLNLLYFDVPIVLAVRISGPRCQCSLNGWEFICESCCYLQGRHR
jgi:hypothetical protein